MKSSAAREPHSSGFTLIEMLISVSLVLMMMVLFAEIFSLASNSMTLQRAIADNDQQVRSFSTILRSDLQKRTFRRVVPYSPLESIDAQSLPFEDRSGYVYISLNDPDNSVDNLLQFTVRSTINLKNGDDSPYYGKATGLTVPGNNGSAAIVDRHIRSNGHQPEHDDSDPDNGTGASTAAEISYFVRGGRLYRRVALLRDPLGVTGSSHAQPKATWDVATNTPVPTDPEYLTDSNILMATGGRYMVKDSAAGWRLADVFWNDFDYSCYSLAGGGTRLVGANDLRTSASGLKLIPINIPPDPVPQVQMSLGATYLPLSAQNPQRCIRFGFDQNTGISREFSHADPSQPGFFFLGRYTLEEQSAGAYRTNPADPAFTFPQFASPNYLSYQDVPALVDAGVEPDGIVDLLANGPRRGQDILVSNVHGFDIEIWDDRLQGFVQPGHTHSAGGIKGDFHRDRCRQLNIVPGNAGDWTGAFDRWRGRIVDTWHPQNDVDNDLTTANDRYPPYRPLTYYPTLLADASDPASAQCPEWTPDTTYNVGDRVFPRNTGAASPGYPTDFSLYYQCITAGRSFPEPVPASIAGQSAEPYWTTTPLSIVEARATPAELMTPEPRWAAILNVRPLRAIRITIRFLHVSSGEMRQMTMVHSLID